MILYRIIVSAALTVMLVLLPLDGAAKLLLFLVPYVIIGYDILIEAFEGIKKREPLDENFLMSLATIGAAVLGDYTEAVAVMIFYRVGELFEDIAVDKSRQSISSLMDIRPDHADIETESGEIIRVSPEKVEPGTVITIRPGERIPIDGVVVSGESSLDTAALTGESVPRDVKELDEVLSGCINLTGLLRVRTTKVYGESTAARILELVEDASSRKARSESFITRFARIYTPAVCAAALGLFLLPPVINLLISEPAAWSTWLYRALTFLVISCPCALVISIPLSFFAGLGGAGSAGVLIKGANYLEALSEVSTVVFDKTGTVTKGVFEVNGIHHSRLEDNMLLEYAAHAECYSSHPIAQSILRAYGAQPDKSRVSEVREVSGKGVTAKVDGICVAVGNGKLMEELEVEHAPCRSVGTVAHVAIDGEYAGHILISDVIKPGAAEAIRALKKQGVRNTVMLTGDIKSVGEAVGRELGIDEIFCELLPMDKVSRVEEQLQRLHGRERLAFVGDGINDAPVLTRADIGIAMGALGADAAIEAADVVLMDDDPGKLSKAVGISKKCIRIVYENIVFAVGVKLACLALGALGVIGMWWAVFADVGVMVIAVMNALRAMHVKRL